AGCPLSTTPTTASRASRCLGGRLPIGDISHSIIRVTTDESPAAPAWQPAIALLDEITRRAEAGAVIRAAYRAGLLERLARPASASELAAAACAGAARVLAVLEVLRSLGIAEVDDDAWSLTPAWAAVVAGESPADLAGFLETPRVRMTQFERS